jgi:CRISPR/Cas system-associated exonuclease Cas4 (RecB family)
MSNREIKQGMLFKKKGQTFDPQKLSGMLEEAYLARRRPSGFTKKETFSPSSIGYGHGTCPRYWYLAFNGGNFVETTDALGVANMAYGTDAHSRIQKLFKEMDILVDEEVEIKLTDPPIRGYLDVLIRWGEEVVVGEIKTTREESFVFRKTTGKPMATHLIQVLIYMKATGKKKGFLLYENKNDQTFCIIPVDFNQTNEEILENVFEWLRLVRKTWEEQTLPARPFRSQNGKVCQACPLNKVCWEDEPEGTIKIAKMEVPKI